MDAPSPPAEVLLVFPPATEARFFPYLSLPMLSAYLRREGVPVAVRDFNIELSHRLFSPEVLGRYVELHAPEARTLKELFRVELGRYLLENQRELFAQGFDKRVERGEASTRGMRLVRQGLELLLEGSLLKSTPTSPRAMLDLLASLEELPESDLAARLQRTLLDEALAGGAPAILAISVPFYSQLLPSLLLARWLKQRSPSTLVILGGQQLMLRHESLARCEGLSRYVDCLGTGAGEETLLKLVRARRGELAREEVPDVVWLGEHGPSSGAPRSTLHLRELPTPDFSDFPLQSYLVGDEAQLGLITCVGCYWGRCVFCSYGNRSRREGYQQKTVQQIANECQVLVERHGIRWVNFIDENTNLRLVLRAMRELNARGVRIRFSVRTRFEELLLSREFCAELAERGCVLMSVGYETNSQRLLDKLDKGVDAAHYQPIVDNLHAVGINLRVSIMGGILDETPEELAASREFLERNAHKIGIDTMQMLVCEPTTLLAADPERYNIRLTGSPELRGNQRLSYGMGRMGHAFSYEDGDTFDARLERFLSIYHSVQPQNNDELPPSARPRPAGQPDSAPRALTLHPWVKVLHVPGEPQRILVDLLWQAFYRLPDSLQVVGALLRSGSESGTKALAQLLRAGVGQPLQEVSMVETTSRIRFPSLPGRLGLGVGMDLPWGESIGFTREPQTGEHITEKVKNFLARHQGDFNYLSFAFQPKDRGQLQAESYFRAYDSLFEAAPLLRHRVFHHTLLNLGTPESYDRRPLLAFTNALIARYGFSWVVEDLGLWSLAGKALPYPLPPFLTEQGLEAAIRNTRVCQEGLAAPLCVEFPGFTEGATFFIGELDAYDFFRILSEETGSPVTIDLGHILSYQWLKGRTGERILEGLERLPLQQCFELHLSGCQIVKGKFRDLHHGVLLDEQLALLDHLLPRCPNLRAVTYEDPKYSNDGILIPKSLSNYQRLKRTVDAWAAGAPHDHLARTRAV